MATNEISNIIRAAIDGSLVTANAVALNAATAGSIDTNTVGGAGANFIVKWTSSREVNVPIVECVMIGMKSGQGISFVSQGQEIKETTRFK